MRNLKTLSVTAAMLAASTALTQAADIIEPPMVEVIPEVTTVRTGGWYLRGDIGYAHVSIDEVLYYQGSATLTGEFEKHDVGDSWMIGGGIGYQVTDYFRVDFTANHYITNGFEGSSATGVTCTSGAPAVCDYSDDADLGVTTLLANAYLDLGNYSGFTPYVGAGIGGALVHWGDLDNEENCVSGCGGFVANNSTHDGNGDWRFAYALHAGIAYDLSHHLKFDAGYSYTHINGGTMFDFEDGNANTGQQGFDGHMEIHAVKAGLRWTLF